MSQRVCDCVCVCVVCVCVCMKTCILHVAHVCSKQSQQQQQEERSRAIGIRETSKNATVECARLSDPIPKRYIHLNTYADEQSKQQSVFWNLNT